MTAGKLTAGKFGPNSRYVNTPVATYTRPDGIELRYLRRRFPPAPLARPIGSYSVTQGDRIDRIAAATLGDPALWWRLADTNLALDPDDLTASVGRRLRIAVEEELPRPEEGTVP